MSLESSCSSKIGYFDGGQIRIDFRQCVTDLSLEIFRTARDVHLYAVDVVPPDLIGVLRWIFIAHGL